MVTRQTDDDKVSIMRFKKGYKKIEEKEDEIMPQKIHPNQTDQRQFERSNPTSKFSREVGSSLQKTNKKSHTYNNINFEQTQIKELKNEIGSPIANIKFNLNRKTTLRAKKNDKVDD